MEITKDTIIGDVLDYDMDTAEFFLFSKSECIVSAVPLRGASRLRMPAKSTGWTRTSWSKS